MPIGRKKQTDPDLETGSVTPPRRPVSHEDVSPAETFDTALTSPTRTFDSIGDSPAPNTTKVAIEHHVKSASNARSAGMLFGMSKPAMGIAGLLFLGLGGATAFGWLKIPGLNTQIQELEEQVGRLNAEISRLSTQVDRLEDENDRYASLNDQLNRTAVEFEILAAELNMSVSELEDVANGLNLTNLQLGGRIDDLTNENENYARLNQELNATSTQLAMEVDYFEDALRELVMENGALSNITASLLDLTGQLGNLTLEQNETLLELQGTLEEFMLENDRLEAFNSNMMTIVSFLNETSLGLDDSLQQITGFLANQIQANQVLLLENIENSYRQKADNWDCDYRDFFREETFGFDFNQPIADLNGVLKYVDERVLSELCLDATDFETYLTSTYTDGITSFRLIRGVQEYSTAAIDYYFPERGEVGLSPTDWADSSFRCENVPPFLWE